jgi:hypothetical protein
MIPESIIGIASDGLLVNAFIHRIAGEIALMSPEPDAEKVETFFERALAVAREQPAKSWELRAAMSIGVGGMRTAISSGASAAG